ncbi:hypothetical protein M441DRAFT_324929 [Trichoderma asperellum CBS 433.97]|uniref:Uncharacterized protein n=1 Tax=Trichoderma asperellum (strain ATCC 204424 / CBS 433.97 / NBRC 101777) TaxID=1042311 RepID=A0A2T3ZLU2_TRIA4|nr:hypothetical protein M441DRAFT_324929 [Trichoderma asperellum CBS 433.97]PTB45774.1 hypothetical protein M441DRAFT_324929 [Trichoderma asperellum CBS 433.97]
MSGRRLRDNVGCACHLSGQGALHCARIGKTPGWRACEICEGRPFKCRSGTISALSVVVVVSISKRPCDIVRPGTNGAFLQTRGRRQAGAKSAEPWAGAVSPQ